MLKVRKGGGEEVPLAPGKEQWLHFAGAAVKRYKLLETKKKKKLILLLLSSSFAVRCPNEIYFSPKILF